MDSVVFLLGSGIVGGVVAWIIIGKHSCFLAQADVFCVDWVPALKNLSINP